MPSEEASVQPWVVPQAGRGFGAHAGISIVEAEVGARQGDSHSTSDGICLIFLWSISLYF